MTCSAACVASGVSALPSRPPAPSRTISFSRSMTSKDRSARTRTTIMCREFVPMSMAASRIRWFYYNGRRTSATYNMSASRRRYELLQRRLEQFTKMLHALGEGDLLATHRTRVASRRLREILPLLELDSAVAERLVRRLKTVTVELGGVREIGVLINLVAELQDSGQYDAQAMRRLGAGSPARRTDWKGT